MSNNTNIPKVYIACLASYNAGNLHGAWIDLDGSEDIEDRISEILEESPVEDAEEWAVHDHEFCGHLSEYAGTDTLNEIKEAFEGVEATGLEWEVFCNYCDYFGYAVEYEHVAAFSDNYAGTSSTLEDWCLELLKDTGDWDTIPQNLRYYFNIKAYAQDLENEVLTIEHNGSTYVFWNR